MKKSKIDLPPVEMQKIFVYSTFVDKGKIVSQQFAGSGIGNLKDDKSLIKLLKELNLFLKAFYSHRSMVFTYHPTQTIAHPKKSNKLRSFIFSII